MLRLLQFLSDSKSTIHLSYTQLNKTEIFRLLLSKRRNYIIVDTKIMNTYLTRNVEPLYFIYILPKIHKGTKPFVKGTHWENIPICGPLFESLCNVSINNLFNKVWSFFLHEVKDIEKQTRKCASFYIFDKILSKISVNNAWFYSFHGCLHEESVIGGEYLVNAIVEIDTSRAEQNDLLKSTVDYVSVSAHGFHHVCQCSVRPHLLLGSLVMCCHTWHRWPKCDAWH